MADTESVLLNLRTGIVSNKEIEDSHLDDQPPTIRFASDSYDKPAVGEIKDPSREHVLKVVWKCSKAHYSTMII